MSNKIVEVGMKLQEDLIYWHSILLEHNMKLVFACITHDIYYTNVNLDGLSERQMKDACVRIRRVHRLNTLTTSEKHCTSQEESLLRQGYIKVFDTIKIDFHYICDGMKNCIQLQQIKDIGLMVYYDNENYYQYSEDKQRNLLIAELNNYGFNFNSSDLGLDKLRTLYYGKEMYSKNQNG